MQVNTHRNFQGREKLARAKAVTVDAAVDGAAEKLQRAVERTLGRLRDH
jgi:hypothetical protein